LWLCNLFVKFILVPIIFHHCILIPNFIFLCFKFFFCRRERGSPYFILEKESCCWGFWPPIFQLVLVKMGWKQVVGYNWVFYQICQSFFRFFFLKKNNSTREKTCKKNRIAERNSTKNQTQNHLGGGLVVRAWDQEVCSLCGLKFEPCGCSYDGHWRFTWSLTSGPMGLVEVRASWPGHPR